MKSSRLLLCAIGLVPLLAAPRLRAADIYRLTARIYLCKSGDFPPSPELKPPAVSSGRWTVLAQPRAMEFDRLIEAAAHGDASRFNLISAPVAIVRAKSEATVMIGENTQYFERLPNGDFRLHEVPAGSSGSAFCNLILSARPADNPAEGLRITCRPDVAVVRDRQTLPGVALAVGKPVIASFQDELEFNAQPGAWSGLLGRTAAGGDYGLLVFLQVTPSGRTIPADLVVDMTAAGKPRAAASPKRPIYYFPSAVGYLDGGELPSGESTPPPEAIDHLLAEALFAQGYRVMTRASPPDVILIFSWGYLTAALDASAHIASLPDASRSMMAALIDGDRGKWASRWVKDRDQAVNSDRFYVRVSAYDAADALRHTSTLLWRARISTAARGISLRDALPTLIAALGPELGRDTPPLQREAPVASGASLGSARVAIAQVKASDFAPESVENPAGLAGLFTGPGRPFPASSIPRQVYSQVGPNGGAKY